MQIHDYKHSFEVGPYNAGIRFTTLNEALMCGLQSLYGKNILNSNFKNMRASAYDYFTITHFYNAQDVESVECEVVIEHGHINMRSNHYSNSYQQHCMFSIEDSIINISDLMKRV